MIRSFNGILPIQAQPLGCRNCYQFRSTHEIPGAECVNIPVLKDRKRFAQGIPGAECVNIPVLKDRKRFIQQTVQGTSATNEQIYEQSNHQRLVPICEVCEHP